MGRGEWISYATYLLSMNGVTYKSRKTFPRNLCVAVFGYDLLRKCTVTGEGSNRNGNVKKPTEKLDPNKVLAIKGNRYNSITYGQNFSCDPTLKLPIVDYFSLNELNIKYFEIIDC